MLYPYWKTTKVIDDKGNLVLEAASDLAISVISVRYLTENVCV